MVGDSGGEVLAESDCFRLLGEASLGRVAVSQRALPAIYPVVYQLLDDAVVFKAPAGSLLSRATVGVVVAFEVDALDHAGDDAWSVLVIGTARRSVALPVPGASWPWTDGHPTEHVAIPVEQISGRRFRRAPGGEPPLDGRRVTPQTVVELSERQMTTIDAVLARERSRHLVGRAVEAQAESLALVERSGALLAERVDALEREAAQLREALQSRTAISTAMGILMARGEVSSEEAFDYLRRVSQNENRKLRDVAADVVKRHEDHIPAARRDGPRS